MGTEVPLLPYYLLRGHLSAGPSHTEFLSSRDFRFIELDVYAHVDRSAERLLLDGNDIPRSAPASLLPAHAECSRISRRFRWRRA